MVAPLVPVLKDVEVAEVAAGVAPSFGERRQDTARRHGHDRTASGVVVAAAPHARHLAAASAVWLENELQGSFAGGTLGSSGSITPHT